MAHTPGDWKPWFNRDEDGDILQAGVWANNVYVALTHDEAVEVFDHNLADPVIEADTHLIAAAPELLAACESFLRAPSIGSSGPGSVTIEVQTFNIEAAERAIAKAKGATP